MEGDATPKSNLKNTAIMVYAFWACGILSRVIPLVGILPLVAVIIAAVKRPDATGTMYESHFTWVIRTFVIGLIAALACLVLVFSPILSIIGMIGMALLGLWSLYRLIKGALKLYENKPIENPQAYI